MTADRTLITGGAGFIGVNLANRLLARGEPVTVFDNLSRAGSHHNLAWLSARYGPDHLRVVAADVRDRKAVWRAATDAARIYHLAGQVAVTTSIADPRGDFEDNALGTLNVLEAARAVSHAPLVVYASTNKVYGALPGVRVVEDATRYRYRDLPHGIPETHPLDFHSPYGCSKGAGDQYSRDYARIFGVRTVVVRQSCIYGPRQFGLEDQGWIAWFVAAALRGRPLTVYGDGKQVRDVLYVDDLLDAYDAIVAHADRAIGKIYNVGGGPARTVSVWAELGPCLERLLGRALAVEYRPARTGDQRVYVSDVWKAYRDLGWQPTVAVDDGLQRLLAWTRDHLALFAPP